ncbi:hypothetical protein CONLIGDRAFT_641615 [Coniochaeta ligniaria NRRL 30616]|uniref:Uncharacterized protein n=1 Tax=Coniochaeta ligniaria NRRL 30616 TaxID=1408157 RepID=A0A1J7JR44_9PEZI|nr:hypothetical protein CONLIGDRAFT_641615 [Coniochaeta ligniaria NRRL 30616]
MDENAQSSTVDSSETIDNWSPSSRPLLNDAAHQAAEYLRSVGLTVAYEDIFQQWMLNEPRKLASQSEDSTGLTSWDGLPDCSIPSTVSAPEQWEASDKSLSFLSHAYKRQSEAEVEGLISQIKEQTEANSIRRLKLELPVLRTDNEIDLRRYKRRICVAREVHLAGHHLPLEPCDEDKDEGLEFPPQAYATDRRIVQSVENEKIAISKHSFQALLKYLKTDWTEADQDDMLRSQVEYKGLISREPITPPLTPKLQAQDAFVPDEETCVVPQPSDPSSLISEDLRKAEDRIFDDDDKPDMSSSNIEQFIDDSADEVDLILIPQSVQKPDDLKAEEPLISAVIEDQTRVSPDFGDIRDSIAHTITTGDDLQCVDTEKELIDSMKETAARVMMGIEQEQLEPLDATIRVDMPIVDFNIPEPEWCKSRGNSLAMFRSVPRQYDVVFNGTRWSRKLIEESKMVWKIWIARDPKPAVEEPIDDKAMLAAFLEPSEDASIPTSSDFVWKKPGLAILDDSGDDDEEELKPLGPPPQPPQGDWATLIKKRKLFLNGDDSKQEPTSKEPPLGDGSRSSIRNRGVRGKLLVQEEEGAAATLLDNYLEMHAPKKMRFEHSPFFKTTEPTLADEAQLPKKIRDKRTRVPDAPAAKESRISKKIPEKTTGQPDVQDTQLGKLMVCPGIPYLDKPLNMLVAVNIPRGMIRHLERLLPGVQMIDRDYNAHNSSIWVQGSVRRSEATSALADEADLISSPSTGIILTTLIKVRQKPLPGAKAKLSLTSRVESIAARYERLVILVSEDNKLDESMNEMSASDAAAFAGLQAFAATLPSETMVLYVGGGVETLAKWAAAMAASYAAGSAHLQEYLVQDETHWELFLRRAGMNAFAAQVVLGMLRAPEGEPSLSHERAYGLPAFVKMAEEQRFGMFEGVLGGRRVLARVGRILDARWGDVVRRKS